MKKGIIITAFCLTFIFIILSMSMSGKLLSAPSDCYKIDRQRSEWIKDTTTSVVNENLSSEIDIRVSPNPSFGYTMLNLSLEKSQKISIEIYNSIGKVIGTIFEGYLISDVNHEIMIKGYELQSGLYYCRIIGDKTNKNVSFILLK